MSTAEKANERLVCRACRRSLDRFCDAMVYLFSHDENFKEFQAISDVFSKYTFLEIDKEEEKTSCICIDCYELLVDFHKFRKMCVVSHLELLKERLAIKECFIPVERLTSGEPEKVEKSVELEECTNEIDTAALMADLEDEEFDDSMDANEEDDDDELSEFEYDDEMMENGIDGTDTDDQAHNGKTKKQYICGFCRKVFTYRASVDKHMMSVHKGTKYGCSVCEEVMLSIKTLKGHDHWHKGDRKYKCDFCTFTTYDARYILVHIRKFHFIMKRQESHLCTYCNKTFSSSAEMLQHLYDQIENIYECGDVATSSSDARPFKCTHCTASFTRKMHWKMHCDGIPKMRTHVCPICEAAKTTECELSRHMSRHKDKCREFSCVHCLRVFYTKDCLDKHAKFAHKESSLQLRKPFHRMINSSLRLGPYTSSIVVKEEQDAEIVDTNDEFILS